ncbi:hypothetical protein TVAG_239490 [Trichomonas vaginalis G3]|uniref:Uncharacterized protein n=1 Tax=Trichomonas vaginalis (strain ATCC PRA-98 / G3) TaxID=412133 RepID=A2DGH7_TRIV3|nr:hypothetical protein TVAG_239490 [Trichomonas vaginalis G3]|eukprot:XP_001581559.1 hypothetical protein [Trichomonas vaginalis G3]
MQNDQNKGKKTSNRSVLDNRRIIISIHSSIPIQVITAIKDTIKTIRSVGLDVSEYVPETTISVTYQKKAMKPMIYFEPPSIDEEFLSNIEENSIIHTDKYDDIDLKTYASYFNIILLPKKPEDIVSSLRFVLVENSIIGEGYSVRVYGDLWKEVLSQIPGIDTTYSNAISAATRNRAEMFQSIDSITTSNGKKINERSLKNIELFFTSESPDTLFVPSGNNRKRKEPNPA